jgi:uncharacterized protein (DUF433 family)
MLQSSRQRPELSLVGVGLYTPAEATRLTGIKSSKIVRWLRGHSIGDRVYEPLWSPQIDIGDGRTYLGFLDLIQARVAAAFVNEGLSPHKVRAAIYLAHDVVQCDYPFASARFRTDGKTIILEVLRAGEDDRLIDLFRGGQYVMKKVIEPSLKGIEFEDDLAARWWPAGKAAGVVVDPRRQFGQPVEAESGIPTAVLATAAQTEGSIDRAAKMYSINAASVRRAVAFEQKLAA